MYVECLDTFTYATCFQGITDVGILEFKRVEGPAELQIAKYCMSKMRALRNSSSRLYLRSFMPMATCEVVGSELRLVSLALMSCQQKNYTNQHKLLCQYGFQLSLCMQVWCCVV